jgi:hypothetical protein
MQNHYILYDKNTQSFISKERKTPYTIDGKLAILPDHLVELTIVMEDKPVLSPGETLQSTESLDLTTNTLTRSYSVVEATPEALAAIAKQEEYTVWQSKLEEGYLDPVTSIKLKTTESAQSLFTSMTALINEAINLGALANDSNTSIWDYHEAEQTMTVLQLRQLLLRYGMYCKSMFDLYKP